MVLPLFAVTLFMSAFLLFLVQPLIGKMILPQLGGTPQVWNTCMVFFQSALLAGYAYTHSVSTRLTLRRQLLVHGGLLLLPLIVLLPNGPFNVAGFEPPRGGNPIGFTLLYLTLVVGLPFFVVSTSAPLLQKWFAHTGHHTAQDPYFLYGASNFGSMLALLAYPFLVEPFFFLRTQAWIWAVGYIFLVGFIMVCASAVWRLAPDVKLSPEEDLPSPEMPVPPQVTETTTAVQSGPPPRVGGRKRGLKVQPKQVQEQIAKTPVAPAPPRPDVVTWWRRLRWTLLAAAPSSLMLGAITYMSTDLSPIPLLWVLPLALYLLTFILVFSRFVVPWTGTPHNVILALQPFLVFLLVFIMVGAIGVSPVWRSTSITLVAFFLTAMVCHGELARDRPSTKHLTEFFLWMSVGGMLGGVFNGLIAPLLFVGVAEYGLALVVACLMRPQQKEEGWSDNTLTNSLQGLTPWFREMGSRFEKIPAFNFSLIVFLVGAAIAGGIFLLGDVMEMSGFMRIVLWGLEAIGLVVILSLRYQPAFTLSYFLDATYPLFLFCLGTFLYYNGQENWNWWSLEPKNNFLLRVLKSLGLAGDPRRDTAERIRLFTQVMYFGIPLIFSLFFATRPLRYGLTVAATLLISIYGAPREREDRTLYSTRSYFGVIRVYRATDRQPGFLTQQDLLALNPTPEEMKKLIAIPTEEGGRFYLAPYTYLMHGTTHHGLNFQAPKGLRRLATTYYHRMGPTGRVMERLNWFPGPQNTYWGDNRLPAALTALGASTMGVGNLPTAQLVCAWSEPPYATVGLGTGTMASYGRPFQHVVFYEIDENIRSFHLPPYAKGGPFFNYLQDGISQRGVTLEVVMGDARQSLQKDYQGLLYEKDAKGEVKLSEHTLNPKRDRYYRVLELDAFSSDAIPVHLITEESIKMYFDKLCEQGVLCVHTSNRHVDLVTPVIDTAEKLGLAYRVGKDEGREASGYIGHFGQEYVMLARKQEYLPPDPPLREAPPPDEKIPVTSKLTDQRYMDWSSPAPKGNPVWTDDYSNLVGVLRERGWFGEPAAFTIFFALLLGISVFVAFVLAFSKGMEGQGENRVRPLPPNPRV